MENLRDFLQNLDPDKTNQFRNYEKVNYKIIEATNSIHFNRNCLREQLCPKSILIIWHKQNV